MKLSIFFVSFYVSMLLCAADSEFVTKKGEVLNNPYLIDLTPSTVTIGHDKGVASFKISDLTPEMQKKLDYDESKAQSYEAEQKKRQAENDKAKAEKAAKEKEQQAKADKNRVALEYRTLKEYVRKQEIRLEDTEKRRDKIDKRIDENRKNTQDLAMAGSSDSGLRYGFGFTTRGVHASSRDSSIRRTRMSKNDDESDRYEIEFKQLNNEIIKIRLDLERNREILERYRKNYPELN